MSDTRCKAGVMAFVVLGDEDIPPCDELGEIEHFNGTVNYRLCVGCDEALRFLMGLGKRVGDR